VRKKRGKRESILLCLHELSFCGGGKGPKANLQEKKKSLGKGKRGPTFYTGLVILPEQRGRVCLRRDAFADWGWRGRLSHITNTPLWKEKRKEDPSDH